MSRGQADFGAYAVKEVTASISDMGEVAARLGSIVIYDKRGDVVDFDNFEEPLLRWTVYAPYDDDYIILDSGSARSGSQAARFTTHNVTGNTVYMRRSVFPLKSYKLGTEMSFSRLSSYSTLESRINFNNGIYAFRAVVGLNFETGKLYVLTTDGSSVEIASGINLVMLTFTFHTLKVVADFKTGFYMRVMLNGTEYDVSAIPLYLGNVASDRFTEQLIQLYTNKDSAAVVWIDDTILTQEEP